MSKETPQNLKEFLELAQELETKLGELLFEISTSDPKELPALRKKTDKIVEQIAAIKGINIDAEESQSIAMAREKLETLAKSIKSIYEVLETQIWSNELENNYTRILVCNAFPAQKNKPVLSTIYCIKNNDNVEFHFFQNKKWDKQVIAQNLIPERMKLAINEIDKETDFSLEDNIDLFEEIAILCGFELLVKEDDRGQKNLDSLLEYVQGAWKTQAIKTSIGSALLQSMQGSSPNVLKKSVKIDLGVDAATLQEQKDATKALLRSQNDQLVFASSSAETEAQAENSQERNPIEKYVRPLKFDPNIPPAPPISGLYAYNKKVDSAEAIQYLAEKEIFDQVQADWEAFKKNPPKNLPMAQSSADITTPAAAPNIDNISENVPGIANAIIVSPAAQSVVLEDPSAEITKQEDEILANWPKTPEENTREKWSELAQQWERISLLWKAQDNPIEANRTEHMAEYAQAYKRLIILEETQQKFISALGADNTNVKILQNFIEKIKECLSDVTNFINTPALREQTQVLVSQSKKAMDLTTAELNAQFSKDFPKMIHKALSNMEEENNPYFKRVMSLRAEFKAKIVTRQEIIKIRDLFNRAGYTALYNLVIQETAPTLAEVVETNFSDEWSNPLFFDEAEQDIKYALNVVKHPRAVDIIYLKKIFQALDPTLQKQVTDLLGHNNEAIFFLESKNLPDINSLDSNPLVKLPVATFEKITDKCADLYADSILVSFQLDPSNQLQKQILSIMLNRNNKLTEDGEKIFARCLKTGAGNQLIEVLFSCLKAKNPELIITSKPAVALREMTKQVLANSQPDDIPAIVEAFAQNFLQDLEGKSQPLAAVWFVNNILKDPKVVQKLITDKEFGKRLLKHSLVANQVATILMSVPAKKAAPINENQEASLVEVESRVMADENLHNLADIPVQLLEENSREKFTQLKNIISTHTYLQALGTKVTGLEQLIFDNADEFVINGEINNLKEAIQEGLTLLIAHAKNKLTGEALPAEEAEEYAAIDELIPEYEALRPQAGFTLEEETQIIAGKPVKPEVQQQEAVEVQSPKNKERVVKRQVYIKTTLEEETETILQTKLAALQRVIDKLPETYTDLLDIKQKAQNIATLFAFDEHVVFATQLELINMEIDDLKAKLPVQKVKEEFASLNIIDAKKEPSPSIIAKLSNLSKICTTLSLPELQADINKADAFLQTELEENWETAGVILNSVEEKIRLKMIDLFAQPLNEYVNLAEDVKQALQLQLFKPANQLIEQFAQQKDNLGNLIKAPDLVIEDIVTAYRLLTYHLESLNAQITLKQIQEGKGKDFLAESLEKAAEYLMRPEQIEAANEKLQFVKMQLQIAQSYTKEHASQKLQTLKEKFNQYLAENNVGVPASKELFTEVEASLQVEDQQWQANAYNVRHNLFKAEALLNKVAEIDSLKQHINRLRIQVETSVVKADLQVILTKAEEKLNVINPENVNLEVIKSDLLALEETLVRESIALQSEKIAEIIPQLREKGKSLDNNSWLNSRTSKVPTSLITDLYNIAQDSTPSNYAVIISNYINYYFLPKIDLIKNKPENIEKFSMDTELFFTAILNQPATQAAIEAAPTLKEIIIDALKSYQSLGEVAGNQKPEFIFAQYKQLMQFANEPYFYKTRYRFSPPLTSKALNVIFTLAEKENRFDVIEMLLRAQKSITTNFIDFSEKIADFQQKATLQVAQDLAELEFSIVPHLNPRDFYEQDKNNGTRTKWSAWTHMNEVIERLKHEIDSSLYNEENNEVRVMRFVQWINMAEQCLHLGAHTVTGTIVWALAKNEPMSHLLEKYKQFLPKESVSKIEKLTNLFHEDKNFKNYREYAQQLLAEQVEFSPFFIILAKDAAISLEKFELATEAERLDVIASKQNLNEALTISYQLLTASQAHKLNPDLVSIFDATNPLHHPSMSKSAKEKNLPAISDEQKAKDKEYINRFFSQIKQGTGDQLSVTQLISSLNTIAGKLPDKSITKVGKDEDDQYISHTYKSSYAIAGRYEEKGAIKKKLEPNALTKAIIKSAAKSVEKSKSVHIPREAVDARKRLFSTYSEISLTGLQIFAQARNPDSKVLDLYKLDPRKYLNQWLNYIELEAKTLQSVPAQSAPELETTIEDLFTTLNLETSKKEQLRWFLHRNPDYRRNLLQTLQLGEELPLEIYKVLGKLGINEDNRKALLVLAYSIPQFNEELNYIISSRIDLIYNINILIQKANKSAELKPILTDLLRLKEILNKPDPDFAKIDEHLIRHEQAITDFDLKVAANKAHITNEVMEPLREKGQSINNMLVNTDIASLGIRGKIVSLFNEYNNDLAANLENVTVFIKLFILEYLDPKLDLLAQNAGAIAQYVNEFEWIYTNVLNTPAAKYAIAKDANLKVKVIAALDKYKNIIETNANKYPDYVLLQYNQLKAFSGAPYFYKTDYKFTPPLTKETFKALLTIAENQNNFEIIEMLMRNEKVIELIDASVKLPQRIAALRNNVIASTAQQLFKLEHYLFSKFTPKDILEFGARNGSRNIWTPWTHLMEVMDRLALSVQLSILKETDPNIRQMRIDQWVDVALYCKNNGALSSAISIYTAITSESMLRLLAMQPDKEENTFNPMQSIRSLIGMANKVVIDAPKIGIAVQLKDGVLQVETVNKLAELEKVFKNDDNYAAYKNYVKRNRESLAISPVVGILAYDTAQFFEKGDAAGTLDDISPLTDNWMYLIHAAPVEPTKDLSALLKSSNPLQYPLMSLNETEGKQKRKRRDDKNNPEAPAELSENERAYLDNFFQAVANTNGSNYALEELLLTMTEVVGTLPRELVKYNDTTDIRERKDQKLYDLSLALLNRTDSKDPVVVKNKLGAAPVVQKIISAGAISTQPRALSKELMEELSDQRKKLFSVYLTVLSYQHVINFVKSNTVELSDYYRILSINPKAAAFIKNPEKGYKDFLHNLLQLASLYVPMQLTNGVLVAEVAEQLEEPIEAYLAGLSNEQKNHIRWFLQRNPEYLQLLNKNIASGNLAISDNLLSPTLNFNAQEQIILLMLVNSIPNLNDQLKFQEDFPQEKEFSKQIDIERQKFSKKTADELINALQGAFGGDTEETRRLKKASVRSLIQSIRISINASRNVAGALKAAEDWLSILQELSRTPDLENNLLVKILMQAIVKALSFYKDPAFSIFYKQLQADYPNFSALTNIAVNDVDPLITKEELSEADEQTFIETDFYKLLKATFKTYDRKAMDKALTDFLLLPAMPTLSQLKDLPINSDFAYAIINGEQVIYIDKKNKTFEALSTVDKQQIAKLVEYFAIAEPELIPNFASRYKEALSRQDLGKITEILGHRPESLAEKPRWQTQQLEFESQIEAETEEYALTDLMNAYDPTKDEARDPALEIIVKAYRAGKAPLQAKYDVMVDQKVDKNKKPKPKVKIAPAQVVANHVADPVRQLLAVPAVSIDFKAQRESLAAIRDQYYESHAIKFTHEVDGKPQKGYIFTRNVQFSSMQTLLRMVDYAEGALLIARFCNADDTTKKQLVNRIMQIANVYMQELLKAKSYDSKKEVEKSIKTFEKYTAQLGALVADYTTPVGLLESIDANDPEVESWNNANISGEAAFKNLQMAAALAAMERGYTTVASVLEDEDGEVFVNVSTPLKLPEDTWENIQSSPDHQLFAKNYGKWLNNAYAENSAIYSSTPFPTHQRGKGAANIREEKVFAVKIDDSYELLFANMRTGFITPKDQRNEINRQDQAKKILLELIKLRYPAAEKAFADTVGQWLEEDQLILPIFYQTLVTPNFNEADEGLVSKIIDREFFYDEAGIYIGPKFIGWDSEAELMIDKYHALADAMTVYENEKRGLFTSRVFSTNHAISTRQKLEGLIENKRLSQDLIKFQADFLLKLAMSNKFARHLNLDEQGKQRLQEALTDLCNVLYSEGSVNTAAAQSSLQKLHKLIYAPIENKPFKTAQERGLMDLFVGIQAALHLKSLLDIDLSKLDAKKKLPLFDESGEFFTGPDGKPIQIPDEYKGLEGNKRFLSAVYEQIMMYGLKALLLGSCKSSADRFGIILTYITALTQSAEKSHGWLLAPNEDWQLRAANHDPKISYNIQRQAFHNRFERLVKLGHAQQVVADNNSTAALKSSELSDAKSLTNKVLEARKVNESAEVKKEKLLSKLRKDGFDTKYFKQLIKDMLKAKDTSKNKEISRDKEDKQPPEMAPDVMVKRFAVQLNALQQTLADPNLFADKLSWLKPYIVDKFALINRYISAFSANKDISYLITAEKELNALQTKIEASMQAASIVMPALTEVSDVNIDLLALAQKTVSTLTGNATLLSVPQKGKTEAEVMLRPVGMQLSILQQTLQIFANPVAFEKLAWMRPYIAGELKKIDAKINASSGSLKGEHFIEVTDIMKKLQSQLEASIEAAGFELPHIDKSVTIISDLPGLSKASKTILYSLAYGATENQEKIDILQQMQNFYLHGGATPAYHDSVYARAFFNCPNNVLHMSLNGLAREGIFLPQNIVVGGTQAHTVGLIFMQLVEQFHNNLGPEQTVQQQIMVLDELIDKIFNHMLDIIQTHSNAYDSAHHTPGTLFKPNENIHNMQEELQNVLAQWHSLYKFNAELAEPAEMRFTSLFDEEQEHIDLNGMPSENLVLSLKQKYQNALMGRKGGEKGHESGSCAQETTQESNELLKKESKWLSKFLGM